jgi:hypothetical protein
MKKITLLVSLALLLSACQAATPANTLAATVIPSPKISIPSPTVTLPPLEKPDDTTFRTLFNELYLTNAQPTTAFNVGDKICPVLDIKKKLQGSISIFDLIKRTEIAYAPFQLDWVDIFQFCQLFGSKFKLAPGNYDYKFRVGNQLVAVLPVQVQTTETGTPAISEHPNTDLFQEYFNSLNISNMQPTTVFAITDRVAVYINVKKEMPVLSGGVYDINKQSYLLAQKFTIYTLLKPGISVVFLPIGIPSMLTPGKYEFKFWVGDTLVEVLPFEVR